MPVVIHGPRFNRRVTFDTSPLNDRSESARAANPLDALNMVGASKRFTDPATYAFSQPASLVSVRGVRLPAHGAGAALMVIENTGELPLGSEYRFQVQQVVRGRVVGGSTYVIRVSRGRGTIAVG